MEDPRKITQEDEQILAAALRIQKKRLFKITGAEEAIEFIFRKIKNKKRENFICVFMDNGNKPILSRVMFRGTTSSCSVHLSDIVKKALNISASCIIIAHNHPSGNISPSSADKKLTSDLKLVCDAIEIRLIDHIIIGRGTHEYYSFRERDSI